MANAAQGGIFCGHNNTMSGTSTGSCIVYGYSNDISGGWGHSYCYVGGYNSHITATSASSDYSSILSGTSHTLTSTTKATIVGGDTNSIIGGSDKSFIGGGELHSISAATHSVICGGYDHTNTGGSPYGTICGGYAHTLDNAEYGTVSGGYTNNITDTNHATISGGTINDIHTSSHYATICGGRDGNITSADYSVILGGNVNYITSGADHAVASGLNAVAANFGQVAHGVGMHDSTAGSAQRSDYIVFNTTADDTWTTLYTNGASTNMLMPANSCWMYEAQVAGQKTDGSQGAGYTIRGVIRRDGAGAATAVAVEAQAVVGEDDATWGGIRALPSGNNLIIQVQGKAATDINWTGTVRVTQTIVES
jgi:hypothetical protein